MDTDTSTQDRRHATAQFRHHHPTQPHPLCGRLCQAAPTAFGGGTQTLPRKREHFRFRRAIPDLVTLEMSWDKRDFLRGRLEQKLPVVLAPDEVQRFLDQVTGVEHRCRAVDLLRLRTAHLQSSVLQLSDIDSRRMLIRVEHGPSAAKPGGAAARANATHRATAEVPQDEDPQNG